MIERVHDFISVLDEVLVKCPKVYYFKVLILKLRLKHLFGALFSKGSGLVFLSSV